MDFRDLLCNVEKENIPTPHVQQETQRSRVSPVLPSQALANGALGLGKLLPPCPLLGEREGGTS